MWQSGSMPGPRQVEQPGQELALGQVAGGAEQHDDVGCGRDMCRGDHRRTGPVEHRQRAGSVGRSSLVLSVEGHRSVLRPSVPATPACTTPWAPAGPAPGRSPRVEGHGVAPLVPTERTRRMFQEDCGRACIV